jgi:hypothetical protein
MILFSYLFMKMFSQSDQQPQSVSVQQREVPPAIAYCDNHSGRPIEFFCLACNVIACSLCAVREHRGPNCECVTTDEALERFRPRIDALRRRFQNQVHRIQELGTVSDSGWHFSLLDGDTLRLLVGLNYHFSCSISSPFMNFHSLN